MYGFIPEKVTVVVSKKYTGICDAIIKDDLKHLERLKKHYLFETHETFDIDNVPMDVTVVSVSQNSGGSVYKVQFMKKFFLEMKADHILDCMKHGEICKGTIKNVMFAKFGAYIRLISAEGDIIKKCQTSRPKSKTYSFNKISAGYGYVTRNGTWVCVSKLSERYVVGYGSHKSTDEIDYSAPGAAVFLSRTGLKDGYINFSTGKSIAAYDCEEVSISDILNPVVKKAIQNGHYDYDLKNIETFCSEMISEETKKELSEYLRKKGL